MKNPIFFTKPRNGKISLWVEMEGHNPHNIWDLPKGVLTAEVLSAIVSAFDRGVSFAMKEIGAARIPTTFDRKWERRDEDE